MKLKLAQVMLVSCSILALSACSRRKSNGMNGAMDKVAWARRRLA